MSTPPATLVVRLLQGLWLALPIAVGAPLADALAPRSTAVATTAAALGWSLWGAGVVALLVWRTVSLTVLRLLVPVPVAGALWAASELDAEVASLIGVVVAAAALVALAAPVVADTFVDGSAYGEERRVALRTPAALQLFVVPVAWAATAGAVVGGPLLIAARQWVVGVVVTGLGIVLVLLVGARLHQLSRRWLVFVPAGVVVHDPLVLTDAMLVPRHLVRRFGPAEVGTDAADLTAGALGLSLELRPAEPLDIARREGRNGSTVETVPAVLVAPGRPGTTLALAADKGLPVG